MSCRLQNICFVFLLKRVNEIKKIGLISSPRIHISLSPTYDPLIVEGIAKMTSDERPMRDRFSDYIQNLQVQIVEALERVDPNGPNFKRDSWVSCPSNRKSDSPIMKKLVETERGRLRHLMCLCSGSIGPCYIYNSTRESRREYLHCTWNSSSSSNRANAS